MSNIWTKERVQKWINDAGYDATVLDIIRYKVEKQLRTDIKVTCIDCKQPFQRNWYNYRREGNGRCFECADKIRRQTLHQKWYARNSLLTLCPNIVDLWGDDNEYGPEHYALNSNKHINFYHRKCGYKWNAAITTVSNSILSGNCGCPQCGRVYKNTLEEFLFLLEQNEPTIKYVNGFTSMREKCLCQCLICNSKLNRKPAEIIEHKDYLSACPVCNGNKIGDEPEYLNSIWADSYAKKIWSNYVDDDFMKSHMPHSIQSVAMPCPDCGTVKNTRITDITRAGKLICKCGDSNSYPNKFVFNVLQQLKISCKCEYTPKWASSFRYDCYLIKDNIIVENHGIQHYEYIGRGRTLDEEQKNDKEKEILAKNNNIYKYIVLDCRKSDVEWIKRSIMNSELPILYGFTENDIDWSKADEYATKNLIRKMCAEWQNGLSIKDASNKYGVAIATIQSWLRKGYKFGWCTYDPSFLKTPVYCFQLNQEFSSGSKAEENTGISSCDILRCCRKLSTKAGTHPDTGEDLVWCFLSEKDTYVPKENKSIKKVVCIETMIVYKSEIEAMRAMKGRTTQSIREACMDIYKTAYGFHWSFYGELTNEKIEFSKTNRIKPAYFYVYCFETKTFYPSIANAQKITGDWHIYDFIMGNRKYAGKSRNTYYAVYDQMKKDGTIISGAMTLGLITEEEALKKLEIQKNN